MRALILVFVVVPLVELYLLVWLSGIIGFWTTVAITAVTGIVGGTLAKREGLRVWRQWSASLDRMQAPEEGVVSGVLVFLGGAFLITPGVLTDALGLALLLPPTRRWIAGRVRQVLTNRIAQGDIRVVTYPSHGAGPRSHRAGPRSPRPPVIDTSGESVSDR